MNYGLENLLINNIAMADSIRKIEEKDFEEVTKLFDHDNDLKEIKWLFSDPNTPNSFNAFVATNSENEIIGVLGYKYTSYFQGDNEIEIVIPMNWIVKSNYKGFAGVLLFKKVSELKEVAIAVWGAPKAKELYKMFKYKHLIYSDNYYKVLKPFSYFRIIEGSSMLKKFALFTYLMPSYINFKYKKKNTYDINLVEYNYNNFTQEKLYDNIFAKRVTKNYIDWLLKCPSVETYGFVVKKGDEGLGICVLYKKKINNTYKGRIVHLPYLGDDYKLWSSVIDKCSSFLKSQGCCFISAIGIHKTAKSAFSESKYTLFKRHSEPIYVKDGDNKIEPFNIDNWYFQYSEGEIAFRNF